MGVMDDLVAMHEYRYPALAGEILNFGPVALEEGHPHLLVVDAHVAQPRATLPQRQTRSVGALQR